MSENKRRLPMTHIRRFTSLSSRACQDRSRRRTLVAASLLLLAASLPAVAVDPPWVTAADNLSSAFTGPIAKALSLVAIVVGGLMFAFGEGGSKRMLSGIVFGV